MCYHSSTQSCSKLAHAHAHAFFLCCSNAVGSFRPESPRGSDERTCSDQPCTSVLAGAKGACIEDVQRKHHVARFAIRHLLTQSCYIEKLESWGASIFRLALDTKFGHLPKGSDAHREAFDVRPKLRELGVLVVRYHVVILQGSSRDNVAVDQILVSIVSGWIRVMLGQPSERMPNTQDLIPHSRGHTTICLTLHPLPHIADPRPEYPRAKHARPHVDNSTSKAL